MVQVISHPLFNGSKFSLHNVKQKNNWWQLVSLKCNIVMATTLSFLPPYSTHTKPNSLSFLDQIKRHHLSSSLEPFRPNQNQPFLLSLSTLWWQSLHSFNILTLFVLDLLTTVIKKFSSPTNKYQHLTEH